MEFVPTKKNVNYVEKNLAKGVGLSVAIKQKSLRTICLDNWADAPRYVGGFCFRFRLWDYLPTDAYLERLSGSSVSETDVILYSCKVFYALKEDVVFD